MASYSRRFCRRLVQHHKDLLEGPEMLDKSITDTAVYQATRTTGVSQLRKREIEKVMRSSSAYETATEVRHSVLVAQLMLSTLELTCLLHLLGNSILQICSGRVCLRLG